jgi:hypothetical protein
MAVERRNPLPPGLYSVFVEVDREDDFTEWQRENAATMRVLSRIAYDRLNSNTPLFSISPTFEILTHVVGYATLFQVMAPTPWDGPGLPTIESNQYLWTEEHTEDPGAHLPKDDPFGDIKRLVLLGGSLYLGGILLSSVLSRRPR